MPGGDSGEDGSLDAARYALAARLIESLLHDARNPLNALSINLEVLTEKLRLAIGGAVPAAQEKNLKAMRDQVMRVDQILRLFAPFIGQGGAGEQPVALSELVQRSADVLAHESRRARVKLSLSIEPEVRLASRDLATARLLCASLILAGIERCAPAGEVRVRVGRLGGVANVTVEVSGAGPGPLPAGLVEAAARMGAKVNDMGQALTVELPLA